MAPLHNQLRHDKSPRGAARGKPFHSQKRLVLMPHSIAIILNFKRCHSSLQCEYSVATKLEHALCMVNITLIQSSEGIDVCLCFPPRRSIERGRGSDLPFSDDPLLTSGQRLLRKICLSGFGRTSVKHRNARAVTYDEDERGISPSELT